MATPTLQVTVQHLADVEFQIYAYRPLTAEEIGREIALFVVAHRHAVKTGTYKIFSSIGEREAVTKAKKPPKPTLR
ncbi:MAG TPA: hypothetical protein VGJ08_16245 [Rhizomicrobium sp.]|jgi:hypothetical protein